MTTAQIIQANTQEEIDMLLDRRFKGSWWRRMKLFERREKA